MTSWPTLDKQACRREQLLWLNRHARIYFAILKTHAQKKKKNFFSVRNAKQWVPVEYVLAVFTFKGLTCKNVLYVLDE